MVMTNVYDLEESKPQISDGVPRSLDMVWILHIQ